MRITGFLTNTGHGGPGRQLPDLDCVIAATPASKTHPRGKDTGLRNLPFRDMDQNRIWVAITALATDLLARLALHATAATYEPKRLRCASSPWPGTSCAPPAAASCASTPPGPGPT